jgi:large subunit ribosomal protein L4
MAVATYTKSGSKATAQAKLDKAVFGVEVDNFSLLKDAYLAHLASLRTNNAVTKKRGEVRGGGRKPWRQKGTGNARFGSTRNPIWRGGGVAFGPTGNENYTKNLSASAKRTALRQALSLAAKEERVKVIDSFTISDGKTKSASALIKKLGLEGNILLVVVKKEENLIRSFNNIKNINVIKASYLNVYEVANADELIVEKPALDELTAWLGDKK